MTADGAPEQREPAASIRHKVILVTGAGRGLGREFAERMAIEGARLLVADVDKAAVQEVADSITATGGEALAAGCDVTSLAEVSHLVRLAKAEFGRLDGVINNAGITNQEAAEDVDVDRWINVINVNLIGTYHVCRQAARIMIDQNSGSIVNLASIHAVVAPSFHKASAYCASKAGVVGLTRALANEWGESGIRVNAIAPGFIETEMTRARLAEADYRNGILTRTPLRRIGRPADLNGAVQFLLSDAASFITGQVLGIDGGWTIV